MKIKLSLIFLLGITEVLSFVRWWHCWLFQDTFYFNFQTLATQLLVASNDEKGLPILLIRVLHNKITGFFWGVITTSLQYIDIRFLEELLGIAGAISMYLGIWYFITKKPKNKMLWILTVLLIIFILLEMILTPHIDFSKRIIPLTLGFSLFSFLGMWQFLGTGNRKIRRIFIVILLVITICAILLFPHSQEVVCLKV